MSLPNSMTIGAGPYEYECSPAESYKRTIAEIVDDIEITPAEAERLTGEIKCNVRGYHIEFNYKYDSDLESFVVTITRCDHGYFRVMNFELEEIRDLLEEKLWLLCHVPEKLSLSEARKKYLNTNK